MGAKRNLANKHIEELINELVAYEEAHVTDSNCPYMYNLLGADDIQKPVDCHMVGCESCKEDFYQKVNENLRERCIVN